MSSLTLDSDGELMNQQANESSVVKALCYPCHNMLFDVQQESQNRVKKGKQVEWVLPDYVSARRVSRTEMKDQIESFLL